jgi:uracil phosphoribosyltransferase
MSKSAEERVFVCEHPVIGHKLAHLRTADQPPREFRRLVHELTLLIGYEATRDLVTKDVKVTTPLTDTTGQHLEQQCAIVPVLRAGLGMTEAMLDLLPNAAVHHIGMYRLKNSEMPVQYYNRLPKSGPSDVAYVLDVVMGSGITVAATVNQLKKWGCEKIVVISIVATPTGIAKLLEEDPNVTLYVASNTDTYNPEAGEVNPGFGDSGDRQFFSPEDMEITGGQARAKALKRKTSA